MALLLAWCPHAFALNPALDVSQYAHTSWKVRDGFVKGTINAVAQTPDGYLWLGTEFGLYRFDGVRAVAWRPPANQQLPSDVIWSLGVGRDGTLWIGTGNGLVSWKNGKLAKYAELGSYLIQALLEDHQGTMWAGASGLPAGRLCAIRSSHVQCFGQDGRFGIGIVRLYEDRDHNLWVSVSYGVWRWSSDSPKFFPLPGDIDGARGFAEADDGALLISSRAGIRRLVGERMDRYTLPGVAQEFKGESLLRDRDGALWIGVDDRVLHVHQGTTDVFAEADGLSGSRVRQLLEDREGNVWVVTYNGLDRFRDLAVATFSGKQGLSNGGVSPVLASPDGSVWLGASGSLKRWNLGRVFDYRQARIVESLFRDDRGRLWVFTLDGLGYLDGDRLVPLTRVPGGGAHGITADTSGNLWVAHQDRGLLRLVGDTLAEEVPWTTLGSKGHANALIADPSRGGLWVGFYKGGVVHVLEGKVRTSHDVTDGLGGGVVSDLYAGSDGAIWAATEGGLSRLDGGRVATLTTRNGLPCDGAHWVMEDDSQALWFSTPCGFVRITRAEMDAWRGDPKRHVAVTLLDASDGVRVRAGGSGFSPRVTRVADGTLWSVGSDGVYVVDPHHLPFNHLAPPVSIEQITADRTTYDATAAGQLRLPALTRDLQIDYTALSLVAPEKNQFRIKLEGWDRDWEHVGNRRQAFYNNLPPRTYRFRVMASNNSGVWNETGAALDFAIAPAYYQTAWFRATVVLAAAALLWVGYQYRLGQIARAFDARMQSRVDERTRIARDLHDTLLQSFHGVMFRFQGAANVLPDRPAEAKERLETAVTLGMQAIREGRDAVQGLRASTITTNDLAVALSSLGDELASADINGSHARATSLDVSIHGTPRPLRPIVRDDIYRIGGEALRNAFRHAGARRIEVEIRYADREFQLRIRDDGRGMDAAMADGHRAGHFGLPGMRERAELVGGRFEVWSEPGMGTEVALTIPGAAVYASPRTQRGFWSSFGRTEADS